MDFAQLFVGFLEPVAFGSVAVLAIFGIVRLRSPRRSPALATRRPIR
jgi:hypothetical protein